MSTNEWKQGIQLISPGLLNSIESLTSPGLNTAESVLDLTESGLEAAALLFQDSESVLGDIGFSATQLKEEVQDFFSGGGSMLITSPFQYGIGHGSGIFRTLTFPDCVAVTASKFNDANDTQRLFVNNNLIKMVSIIVGAGTPAQFLQSLEYLYDLLSLKEIRFAIRKIKQLLKLNSERMVLKKAPFPPFYSGFQLRDIPQLQQAEMSILQVLNFFLAWDKKLENMLDVLSGQTAKKKQQVVELRSKLVEAIAIFNLSLNSNGVYRYYSEANSTDQLRDNLLQATGGAGAELALCFQIKFVATGSILDPIKEILDL